MKTKDATFTTLFFKHFILFFLMFLLIFFSFISQYYQHITNKQQMMLDNATDHVVIQLAQLKDTKITQPRFEAMLQAEMAKVQNDLTKESQLKDIHLNCYNMTNSVFVTDSKQMVLFDEDLNQWWRQQNKIETGIPQVSQSNELYQFLEQHKDATLVMKKAYVVNGVIVPTEIEATKNQKSVKYEIKTPMAVDVYDKGAVISVVGSDNRNNTAKQMANYQIGVVNQDDETPEIAVSYKESAKMKVVSKTMFVNGVKYQIDCGYQYNFLLSNMGFIALLEFLLILLSAIGAFISSKINI